MIPLSPKSIIIILLLTIYGFGLNACLQSVRRPERPKPTWAEEDPTGNTVPSAHVEHAMADSTNPQATATAANSADSTSTNHNVGKTIRPPDGSNATLLASLKPAIVAAPVQPANKAPAGKRARKATANARQVNEYALWCIENGMWKEAQLHIENAIQHDSLSASFHNNLGIIYERLGQPEKAIEAYNQARLLQPGRQAYQINLQRLETRQRKSPAKAPDSLQTAPNDSLKNSMNEAEARTDSFKDAVANMPTEWSFTAK